MSQMPHRDCSGWPDQKTHFLVITLKLRLRDARMDLCEDGSILLSTRRGKKEVKLILFNQDKCTAKTNNFKVENSNV